ANVDEMFKLFDVKSTITDKPDAITLTGTRGHIVFNNVGFRYKKDRTILKSVSIDFRERSSTALVGYSGSGKSTISKLIFRLYDVTSGSISIDGVDIRDVTQRSLRENIGIVAQDTILFNDSIYNNIQYGNPSADKKAVVAAAYAANIHDFITGLPDGYDTEVGERGVKLSGGEKQRVAIARMLLKDPPILLFDEATASLDSKSEKMIQDAIKEISKEGRTTIVIAHRLSTIVDFDKIIVMDQGKVIGEGTHQELMKSCGTYQKLWLIQSRSKS
ncbi:ATP-binding cassette domain-containing protein, partial [Patescibacteria group bacterium]|nr:ATP-binding cassette domain-containing protein [Patescibacteria group bacterium]